MKPKHAYSEETQKLINKAKKATTMKGTVYSKLEASEITLQMLYDLPYNEANKTVQSLPAERKLELLEEISSVTDELYYRIKTMYIDKAFPKPDELIMTPKEYHRSMGRIKHYETIAEFIYESTLKAADIDEFLDAEF